MRRPVTHRPAASVRGHVAVHLEARGVMHRKHRVDAVLAVTAGVQVAAVPGPGACRDTHTHTFQGGLGQERVVQGGIQIFVGRRSFISSVSFSKKANKGPGESTDNMGDAHSEMEHQGHMNGSGGCLIPLPLVISSGVSILAIPSSHRALALLPLPHLVSTLPCTCSKSPNHLSSITKYIGRFSTCQALYCASLFCLFSCFFSFRLPA